MTERRWEREDKIDRQEVAECVKINLQYKVEKKFNK